MGERMKSFWLSLLFFVLLLCSCKTKEVGCEVDFTTKEKIETNYTKYQVLVDTSNVLKIGIDKSKLTITEHIIITKYDKDTGAVTEKTTTEREITQDSNQVVTEEKEQTVTNRNQLKVNQSIDTNKKVESEVTEESEDASVALWREIGRYIGIIIAFVLAFKIFWRPLKEKF